MLFFPVAIAAIAYASVSAFLAIISLSVGLPSSAGPVVGIFASSLLHLPSPSAVASDELFLVMDIQRDISYLAHRSSCLSAQISERASSFNAGIEELMTIIEEDFLDRDKKMEIVTLLLDVKRASIKMSLGVAELEVTLHGSLKRFTELIDVESSAPLEPYGISNRFLANIFASSPPQSFHLLGTPTYFLTALNDECDTALVVIDQFHADLRMIKDDLLPRLELAFAIDKEYDLRDTRLRHAIRDFVTIARAF
ncbi:hypothetical protein SCHPADRAFT_947162 [Schizopora paradoxa]|uniref:Uncharacterized protein n=1 Tax=Schizopora paradoxa TaxID=27342 RepID=A0A0H2R6K8_9AGAM|nr:hypothetical protein SCHPADRAFT_947162 [Schizopora paradoxa]